MVLRGLSRALPVVAAICLGVPLLGATVDILRAPECAGALRFAIQSEETDQSIDVAAGVSSFDTPAGMLTLIEPALCWSAPVAVGEQVARLKVSVLKARLVRGSIAPSDRTAPNEINVTFRPPKLEDGTLMTDVATVDDDRTFTLRLPAEPLDLRIGASRFAPVYLWRFNSDKIAPLKFVPGASVSGWVTTPRKMDLTGVTIRLIPATATWQSPEDESQKLQSRSVRADESGFFQIVGVSEGAWSLVAEAPHHSPTRPRELELVEGMEEALRTPLELRAKGSLSIGISPLVDFDGEPWRVELQRQIPLSRYTKPMGTEPASFAGQWTKEDLEAGHYVVRILGNRGETMKKQEIELAGEAAYVDVRIDAIAIHGEITIGGKPLRAAMEWLTLRGERLTIQSDEEGAFASVLPKAGTWYVDVRSGSIEYLSRKRIEVEESGNGRAETIRIKIPGGIVRGKVVDRSGRAVKTAAFIQRGPQIVRDMLVADDGSFEFAGLEEGTHTVRAEGEGYMSGAVPVSVSESSVAEVVLVVDPTRRVEGWLTTSGGAPLAGAQIWYWSTEYTRTPAQSGPSGQFSLLLPSGTTMVELAIVTPSRPSKLIALPLPPRGERLHVTVSHERSVLRLKIGSTPPYPWVFSRGAATTLLSLLRMPTGGMPPEWLDYETGAMIVALEPGTYDFCDSLQRRRCVVAQANAGATSIVDLTELWSSR